jgi:hypothetical protein
MIWYDIRGVSKKFGEWYQKTNKTEYTNKLTILAFKIIATRHNTPCGHPRKCDSGSANDS